MRPDYRPRSALAWLHMPVSILLMIVLVICFALQQVDQAYFDGSHLPWLMLSNYGLAHGYVWQLLTFQFLHGGVMHLACNLIGIWFFGRFIEERLGKGQLLAIYFLSGIVGGLFQSLLGWAFPVHYASYVIGASCGVMAFIAAFSLLEPDAPIFLFFILPLRARYLLYIETAIALFFTVVPADNSIAHAAHLGGIAFAVAYMKWGLDWSRTMHEWSFLQRKKRTERMIKAATVRPPMAALRRRPRPSPETPLDLPSDEFISKEVDPILDKISEHGIQSLTERERAILQAARNKMSKR